MVRICIVVQYLYRGSSPLMNIALPMSYGARIYALRRANLMFNESNTTNATFVRTDGLVDNTSKKIWVNVSGFWEEIVPTE